MLPFPLFGKSFKVTICTFNPFFLKMTSNFFEAVFKACKPWILSISSEKAKAFCPVSILFPMIKIWEQKLLKTRFRTAVFIHLSRSPKDSILFKSKNWDSAIPANSPSLNNPIKWQDIFVGADFSKTLKYSLLRKILSRANAFQFSGRSAAEE